MHYFGGATWGPRRIEMAQARPKIMFATKRRPWKTWGVHACSGPVGAVVGCFVLFRARLLRLSGFGPQKGSKNGPRMTWDANKHVETIFDVKQASNKTNKLERERGAEIEA